MNFLAHAFLSGNDEHLLIGNFIADFVKGKAALARFDERIQRGIALHRAIDAFTDLHPIVSKSKNRLRPKYRHYSGVIIDVFYDHFLAKNWADYHPKLLSDFAFETYAVIMNHTNVLPENVKYFFPYMVRENWFMRYTTPEGINLSLTGMSRRTPYESKMDEATVELVRYYGEFEEEFRGFFPLLVEEVNSKIAKF